MRDERKKNADYYAAKKERENARCRAYHARNREKRLAVKATWRDANRESEGIKARERYHADPEASREYHRQWRLASGFAQYSREWRAKNGDRCKSVAQEWLKNNRGRMRAKVAARRARKIMATPAWADASAINAIYEECARLTAATGIPHEVDHIIPLKGETVCGLHVHQNLRIVTQSENRRKHTKLEPGCEDFWPPDQPCAGRRKEGA